MRPRRIRLSRAAAAAAALVFVAACAGLPEASRAPEAVVVPERSPGVSIGYLDGPAFDSAAFVPPPPQAGSAAHALDAALATRALAQAGTPRWDQAAVDADLDFPAGGALFACALGVPVDSTDTPHLVRLLRRSLADAAVTNRAAKDRWQRPRPFLANGGAVCTPADDARLRESASYPSGHASIGWTWTYALIAAAPERSDALLQRGRDFAESRLVCNVHWHSDLVQSQTVGAATFARLQDDASFLADLAAARREIAAQRARGAQPSGCAAEAAALQPADPALP
ncbi:acid phosphatase [Luteimonas deserti]|uniref:Acid phosphatase n=1 Tax=Luteimonas deserti TaxID=2752306 RepID=A0A7Z0QPN7_9GAMM|nr:phosphatase PAP2 family protein [Luteimonas deserti]NYZ61440.1 phosphatase PAP2 family protein [Luteimonas deserti]